MRVVLQCMELMRCLAKFEYCVLKIRTSRANLPANLRVSMLNTERTRSRDLAICFVTCVSDHRYGLTEIDFFLIIHAIKRLRYVLAA